MPRSFLGLLLSARIFILFVLLQFRHAQGREKQPATRCDADTSHRMAS